MAAPAALPAAAADALKAVQDCASAGDADAAAALRLLLVATGQRERAAALAAAGALEPVITAAGRGEASKGVAVVRVRQSSIIPRK